MRLLLLAVFVTSIAVVATSIAVDGGGQASAGGPGPRNAVQVIIVDYPRGHVPDGVPAGGPAAERGTVLACTSGASTDQCNQFVYEGRHWETLPVEYWVNPSGDASGPACESAIVASAQTWEDDPGSSFDLTYRGTTDIGNSSLRNRMDGVNVVTWDNLRRYPGAIAVTSYWYYTSTGEVVETDMALNKALAWSASGAPNAYDCQNIVTHEFGHFLVLGELYDGDAQELTMYGYGSLGETKKSTLGVGDQLGIAAIYPVGGGPPPSATPTPTSGAEPTPTATSEPEPTATPTPDDGGPGFCPPGQARKGLC